MTLLLEHQLHCAGIELILWPWMRGYPACWRRSWFEFLLHDCPWGWLVRLAKTPPVPELGPYRYRHTIICGPAAHSRICELLTPLADCLARQQSRDPMPGRHASTADVPALEEIQAAISKLKAVR